MLCLEEQMGEILTCFPAQQQGFCLGTVVSSELSPGHKTNNPPQARWMTSTEECQDTALEKKKKKHQALLEHSQNSQFKKNPICISISHPESKRRQERTSFIISSTAITIDSYRILPYEGPISNILNIFQNNCS